jgi:hypothetical protein
MQLKCVEEGLQIKMQVYRENNDVVSEKDWHPHFNDPPDFVP